MSIDLRHKGSVLIIAESKHSVPGDSGTDGIFVETRPCKKTKTLRKTEKESKRNESKEGEKFEPEVHRVQTDRHSLDGNRSNVC